MIERSRVQIPAGAAGEFSSPGSTFCADSYFGVPPPPTPTPLCSCVTTVARKRSRSFCQRCRWQVTAKYACTLRMWLCMKWHGAWLYGVHRTRQDGSSFMWHQPCHRCKYSTSVDIQKRAVKKLLTHAKSCERSESARERRIALYKSDQQACTGGTDTPPKRVCTAQLSPCITEAVRPSSEHHRNNHHHGLY